MNIMFRVALFLRDELSLTYNLIPSDVVILLLIASHVGDKEFWYIPRPQLARECRLKPSQFTRRLKKLESQKLIKVKRTGLSNGYGLTLPKVTGKPWCADEYSSTHLLDADEYSSTQQKGTRVPIRKVLEYPHKETLNKHKKTERRTKRASALSASFSPNLKAQDLCKEKNLDLSMMTQKFVSHSQAQGKTYVDADAAFELFVMNEKPQTSKAAVTPVQVQPKQYDYPPQCLKCGSNYGCRCYVSTPETVQNAMKSIKEKLKGKLLINRS